MCNILKTIGVALPLFLISSAQGQNNKSEADDVAVEVHPAAPHTAYGGAGQPRYSSNVKRHPGEVRAVARQMPGDKSVNVLIVRSSKADDKSTAQLKEDMAVMYRILEKSIGEQLGEDKIMKMGIPVFTLQGMGTRCIYLEDYGAVFTFGLDIPFVPEEKTEKKTAEDRDESNEEWEQAKNDLFGGKHGPRMGYKSERPYNAEQVDEIKNAIIEALHNASNIRNLKNSDWISVVLRSKRGEESAFWPMEGNRFKFELDQAVAVGADDSRSESTMVFRIKKAELEEGAKKKGGKTSLKEKVAVTIY